MRLLTARLLLTAALLLGCGNLVHAAPPTQSQIDELLKVTRVRESIANMLPHLQASHQQMIQQLMAGRELSEQQQQQLDKMMATAMKTVAELLSWEQLQPLYRDLYAQTFDAEEVQAMIDFYASPTGQSMVQKMPLLMQNAMQAVQERLIPFLQELQHNIEQAYSDEPAGHQHAH